MPSYSNELSIETNASSTSTYTTEVVVKDGEASSTTFTINAPYGVKSEIVDSNGQTYATATALTLKDAQDMERQQTAVDNQMNQIFQDQQKLFNDIWAGF